MLRKLVPHEIETTIRTNKTDYRTYQTALSYVQATLARHYERSHPTPMDIDAADNVQKGKRVSFDS